ncbi:serine/threonine protein phosphatase [Tardiphaga sp. vice352]|uniref:RAD55 family ATPase n=1 Tax=unclassified Tardiphaga TaxID=2631404 RepID=UPI0011645676|nr:MULTISPECIES: ATPase domain-containing protein [unclassified Tardiphaga]QDM22516.1 serine/threonine protein phosphatase [Tardiphaga sp. vice154]QDM27804.1 serine/threonine protein phosphatase [Tardiphaga sp. vice304]QDM32960.1 serine/threonine protein phosphatase [Tardiphaga sp. vice352]
MTSDSDRFATGVPGLDTILGGGVFDGGIYIIQGAPGAGKTILGNQICFAQAAMGRNALYITLLAESHARMIGHMRRLKFFDEAAIPDRMSYVGAFKTLDDDGLRGLLDVVRREVRTRKASIVVLDGLITVHEKAGSDLELKKFIHELQTQASFSNCTMFLLTSAFDANTHPPEHTMVDGLIELRSSLHGRRAERSLQVHKLRGSWFMGGKHSYRITENGHAIYPRVEALLETPSVWDSADGPKVSIGIPGVDAMFGGGVDTHSVTVVLGPSGSGKTTSGLQFLTGGPADEPAMHFGFHENPRALTIKAETLKLPLTERGDLISLLWRPQTEAILDEVATELLGAIKARGVRRLVIDGIEGFSKLTDEKGRMGSFLSALCNELRALGVTTLATAETEHAGVTPGQPLKGMNQTGLSAVAENILSLQLAALRSENHRLMTILKSRDRRTDMRMRRFEIGEGGIRLDDDYLQAERILRDISSQGPATAPSADLKLTGE